MFGLGSGRAYVCAHVITPPDFDMPSADPPLPCYTLSTARYNRITFVLPHRNHINNVEKRLGVAVPGVLCCFASALAVVAAYYNTDSSAGLLLSPSAVWCVHLSVCTGTYGFACCPP